MCSLCCPSREVKNNYLQYNKNNILEIFNKVLNDFNKTLLPIQSPSASKFPCNCRPDCEFNHYTSELSSGKLNVKLSVNESENKK